MNTNRIEHPDYLVNERITLFLNHGYYGYKVESSRFDDYRGQMIVVARNDNGNALSAYGETEEDACRDLIDLIDIRVNTL